MLDGIRFSCMWGGGAGRIRARLSVGLGLWSGVWVLPVVGKGAGFTVNAELG